MRLNMEIKYFDNSASTKIKREVLEEMVPYLSNEYGNASAIYSLGRNGRKAIELSRRSVASLINCSPEEIYFTSCGSESDNTALKGFAFANRNNGKHIITSKIEHPAILNSCKSLENKGFHITYIGVNSDGFINLDELKRSIRRDTILISIMYANNEVGTIQPIKEISKIAHSNGIAFHTDAVQAVGNVDIDVQKIGIDMLSLSGHKIYAPKGIGALYVRKGINFESLISGGHQEKNKRAGTENVAEIVGLGKACEIEKENLLQYQEKLSTIRNYCLEQLKNNFTNIQINGSMENRLPGNINVSFIGYDSEELLYKLDEFGVCASGGSACSSGNTAPSHVLTAMGIPPQIAKSAIRFSFGDFNTIDDVDYLISVLKKIL